MAGVVLEVVQLVALDVPSGWAQGLFFISYGISVAGLVVLMTGLKRVPDRVTPDGRVHYRAQHLLIGFGATMLGLAVGTFFVLLVAAFLASWIGWMMPLMIPVIFVGGILLALAVTLPLAVVGVIYLVQGITMMTRRKAAARR